jgi:hypothetical protein
MLFAAGLMSKKAKHPVVEPLPNNGVIQVHWGDNQVI